MVRLDPAKYEEVVQNARLQGPNQKEIFFKFIADNILNRFQRLLGSLRHTAFI